MAEKEIKTQGKVVADWAEILVRSLQKAMDKKGIKSTKRELYDSVVTNLVSGGNGDIDAVYLRFLFHGRFVDMGVGKGVPIGGASKEFSDVFSGNRRKAKKWYSPTTTHEIYRLADIMNKLTGQKGINAIESGLTAIELVI